MIYKWIYLLDIIIDFSVDIFYIFVYYFSKESNQNKGGKI